MIVPVYMYLCVCVCVLGPSNPSPKTGYIVPGYNNLYPVDVPPRGCCRVVLSYFPDIRWLAGRPAPPAGLSVLCIRSRIRDQIRTLSVWFTSPFWDTPGAGKY